MNTDMSAHVDCAWFRQTLEESLRHWLDAAACENGFFRAHLDRQWRPAAEQQATLTSQSRLVFVMATGWDVTRDERYRRAAQKGAEFLLNHFRAAEPGCWHGRVAPDGGLLTAEDTPYGRAFVVLALAHAYRITRNAAFNDAAMETVRQLALWQEIEAAVARTAAGRNRSQNPIMHTFEALLALHDATHEPEIDRLAHVVADFVFSQLFQEQGGYLPEEYTAGWTPKPSGHGGHVDVGHQFEWAFLLSWAVTKGFPETYIEVGKRLLDFGLAHGYDSKRGEAYNRCSYSGEPDGTKGWWQQCELLRALMRYAVRHGRSDVWPPFDQSLQFFRSYIFDPEYGGFYGSARDFDRPECRQDLSKGRGMRVGYHDTGMLAEGLSLCRDTE